MRRLAQFPEVAVAFKLAPEQALLVAKALKEKVVVWA